MAWEGAFYMQHPVRMTHLYLLRSFLPHPPPLNPTGCPPPTRQPHFKTIPEPPPRSAREALLRPRDHLGPAGLRQAGYNTAAHDLPVRTGAQRVRGIFADAAYFLKSDHYDYALHEMEHEVFAENELELPEGGLRRR